MNRADVLRMPYKAFLTTLKALPQEHTRAECAVTNGIVLLEAHVCSVNFI